MRCPAMGGGTRSSLGRSLPSERYASRQTAPSVTIILKSVTARELVSVVLSAVMPRFGSSWIDSCFFLAASLQASSSSAQITGAFAPALDVTVEERGVEIASA